MNWHNPKYASSCSGNGEKIRSSLKAKAAYQQQAKETLYLESPNYCKHCSSVLPYAKRANIFCNSSCSASHNNPKRAKPKQHNPIKKENRNPKIIISCKECGDNIAVPSWEKSRKYCSVECSNKNKYHPNSIKKHTSIYKGYKMDSGAELAFAQLLDSHNITWIKNSTKFFTFIDSKGVVRKYYPDFYLTEYDHWVEIKGKRYIREDDDLRLKSVGDNIELIMSHDIRLPSVIMAD